MSIWIRWEGGASSVSGAQSILCKLGSHLIYKYKYKYKYTNTNTNTNTNITVGNDSTVKIEFCSYLMYTWQTKMQKLIQSTRNNF